VSVNLPKADAAPVVVGEEEIIIYVTNKGEISVGNKKVSLDELPEVIEKEASEKAKNEVYLKADENTRYGIVAQVMAKIKAAGISGLGIITEPPHKER
jgi:biopolymer transport protein ExbD